MPLATLETSQRQDKCFTGATAVIHSTDSARSRKDSKPKKPDKALLLFSPSQRTMGAKDQREVHLERFSSALHMDIIMDESEYVFRIFNATRNVIGCSLRYCGHERKETTPMNGARS